MKQILIKIFKIFLVLTAVVLGLLLIFGIALALGWPWWVGLFILVGILGIWLSVIFFKKIWLRRREQQFVNQVIEQDDQYLKQMNAKEKEHHQELQHRWKEAMVALKQSHLKKLGNPLYVLPWYMVIGESGSGKTTAIESARLSSPFAEVSRTSGISGTRNCDWWFFEQAILVDTAGRYAIPVDEGRDKDEWQNFLALLAKFRKREPLNGLVVTVSADKLLESGSEVMEADGKSIRQRVDELMRVLGAKFPIYVLVTKCDLVQGMNPFCGRLTDETLDQPMGLTNQNLSNDIAAFLDRSIAYIGERLRDLRLLIFHKADFDSGHPSSTDPALLLFPEEFERLKAGLTAFFRGAFQENPYQETPILRGLFFSSGRQEGSPYSHFLKELGLIAERDVLPGTNKGLFLHDFFARILPQDRALFVPTQRALNWGRFTQNIGLTAWLAVGIALCGLLSYSFVKNLWTLHDVSAEFKQPPVFKGEVITDISIMDRYREAISKVIEKNRGWWIPRFGLYESRNVEQDLKARFCKRFEEIFQTKFDKDISRQIGGFTAATPPDILARYLPHIIRRINLSQFRLEGADLEELQAMPPPGFAPLALAAGHENTSDQIAENYELLYLYYLIWQSDENRLNQELNTLRDWLNHALTLDRANLDWMVFWVNNHTSVKAVRLEDFWGSDLTRLSQTEVAAAYTLDGKKELDSLMTETEKALIDPLTLSTRKGRFEGRYQEEYISAWEYFAANFPAAADLLRDKTAWQQVAARMPTGEGPYFALLNRMADELRPYSPRTIGGTKHPAWVKLVYALEDAQDQAAGEKAVKEKKSILAKTTKKGKALINKLDKKARLIPGSRDLAARMAAGQALYEYQSALVQFVPAASSQNVAFQMAGQVFKKGAAPDNSAYFKAHDAYNRLKATLSSPGFKQDFFWPLLVGPLNFLGAFICSEAACQLQVLWEDEVLVEVTGTSDQMDLNQLLFSPEGHAVKFMQGPAKPFIGRKLGKGYYAQKKRGLSIAFEPAFLTFLSKGARSSKPVKANYVVTFKGLPTSANREARIQPHATRLELECVGKTQNLVNRNYPIRKTFNWAPQTCGDVLFAIEVGNMVLTRKYKGFRAFAKFLKDFSKGRRTFYPGDFPDQAGALKRLGIKHIVVQYEISGSGPAIAALHAATGRVPREIAKCWAQ
ncbi:MAG: type VI secretion system protein ImpL [bacterium]|nr:type VI secretion system protein ImpL [bacterium]